MNDDRLTYFIITRKIFDSAIWRDDPHILKLFIYLIGQARHSKEPKKYNSFEIKRGELVTSLSIIADDNEYMKFGKLQKWSRAKVSRMLETLKEQNYIEIISDTYGTHIKVCNYDTYQDPTTYKSDATETQLKQTCNGPETELNTNNNDNNVKNVNNESMQASPTKNLQERRTKGNNEESWRYRIRKNDEPIFLTMEMILPYFIRKVNEKDFNELNNLAEKYGKYVVIEAMHKSGGKMRSTRFLTEEMLESIKQELELRKNLKNEEGKIITKVDIKNNKVNPELIKTAKEVSENQIKPTNGKPIQPSNHKSNGKFFPDRDDLIPGYDEEKVCKKYSVTSV